ncbi:MAG: alginate export family protein, partial [Planctomycetes bacterium]|nr:alginate export family protein [Planctomycetota bacterium]
RLFGSHRSRFQGRAPTSYAAGPTNRDSSFDIWARTRLGLETRIAPWANGLIEIQDVRRFGEDANGGANNLDGLDLLQGYFYSEFDYFGFDTTMRVGRQRFTIGNQRLFSTLEFHPAGRAWDGITFDAENEDLRVRKLWLMLDDGARAAEDNHLLGFTIQTWLQNDKSIDLEAALLYEIEGGTAADRSVLSASIRSNGKVDAFDYSAELIGQFGDQENGTPDDDDVSAHAFALTAGYTFNLNENGKFRLGLEYAHASGDSDATDDKVETFRSPFPFGHKFHGIADVVGWRNLSDFALHAAFDFKSNGWYESLKIGLQFHHFQRVEDEDGVYNPGNGLVRAGTAADSDSIGSEFDIQVNLKINDWFTVEAAWGHFMAGDFFSDTQALPTSDGSYEDGDTDFFWLAATLSF